MLVTFTNDLVPLVLADDANLQGGGKVAFTLRDFAFDSGVMIQPCYGAATPFKAPTGNVDRKLSFVGTQSLATPQDVLVFLSALSDQINQVGNLVLQEGAKKLTFPSAILKAARREPGESVGTRIAVFYQFEMTNLTIA
jgi:hypothetical protein